jgi:hypothetical protein
VAFFGKLIEPLDLWNVGLRWRLLTIRVSLSTECKYRLNSDILFEVVTKVLATQSVNLLLSNRPHQNQNHDDQQETFSVLCSRKRIDARTVTQMEAESRSCDLWWIRLWKCHRKPGTQTDKLYWRNWGRASSRNQTNPNRTSWIPWGRASRWLWRKSTSQI